MSERREGMQTSDPATNQQINKQTARQTNKQTNQQGIQQTNKLWMKLIKDKQNERKRFPSHCLKYGK